MFDTMIPLFADSPLALIPHNMSFGLMWLFCYGVFLVVVYRLIDRFLIPDIRFGYTIMSVLVIQVCLSFLRVPSFLPVTLMTLFLQSTISALLMVFSPNVTAVSGKQAFQLLFVFGVLAQILQMRARRKFKKDNKNKEDSEQYAEDANEVEAQLNKGSETDGFSDGPPDPNQSW